MASFQLRRGLSFCDLGSHLIFLDVEADRYFCLADQAEAELRALIAAAPRDSAPPERFAPFVERGLLVTGTEGAPLAACTPPPPPATSLLDTAGSDGGSFATVKAVLALMRSLARLRWGSLKASLAWARPLPRMAAACPAGRLAGIAAAFDKASRWMSSQDRCLAQSLAVARTARRAGLAVDIVIGVSLGPFAAHCWVQHGAAVVNDRVETVLRYTPILVA